MARAAPKPREGIERHKRVIVPREQGGQRPEVRVARAAVVDAGKCQDPCWPCMNLVRTRNDSRIAVDRDAVPENERSHLR